MGVFPRFEQSVPRSRVPACGLFVPRNQVSEAELVRSRVVGRVEPQLDEACDQGPRRPAPTRSGTLLLSDAEQVAHTYETLTGEFDCLLAAHQDLYCGIERLERLHVAVFLG